MINSFVWVLFVYTYGGNFMPTLEFTTRQKCEVAALVAKRKINSENYDDYQKSHCIRIKK